MTESLVEWLSAQLDVDQKLAQSAHLGPWRVEFHDYAHESYWLVESRAGDVVTNGYEGGGATTEANAAHIAAWDPARVLAEVAAKRRIIAEHPTLTIFSEDMAGGERIEVPEWYCRRCFDTSGRPPWDDVDRVEEPCPTLRLLALPYAGRDGWREEWAPDPT